MVDENIKKESNSNQNDTMKQKVKKIFASILLGSGLITAVLNYKNFLTWLSPIDIFHLPNPVIWSLYLVILIAIFLAYYYMKKPAAAPNFARILFIVAVFCGIIIINQQKNTGNKIIVVYDEKTIPFNPKTFDNFESQQISELKKLNDIGQLDENTVLLSTMKRPELVWKEIFPIGSKISSPILSIQEVLDDPNNLFVDISFLDFDEAILDILENRETDSCEIRIFYEYGYEIAEKILSNQFDTIRNISTTNSILFNPKSFNSFLDKKYIIIFLGSENSLLSFMEKVDESNYKMLIAPTWLRQYLPKNLQPSQKRICGVSSIFEKLYNADTKTWDILVKAIKSDWKDEESLKNTILSNFFSKQKIINKEF